MHRSLVCEQSLKRLTIKYFQCIKLLFTLENVHEDRDVVVWLHSDAPRARLGVKIVAWIPWTKDDPRRFCPDFTGWALC